VATHWVATEANIVALPNVVMARCGMGYMRGRQVGQRQAQFRETVTQSSEAYSLAI
jgi:hypothetical protein